MTLERFSQVVDDPELLRRITYEELKTLALAYPYAHNLRCLLAIKARQIDHPDAAKNLATAAAYSLDRTKLFLLVAPQVIAPQQMVAPEEILELKPIETVKRELEALAPLTREEKPLEPPIAADTLAHHIPPAEVEISAVQEEIPTADSLEGLPEQVAVPEEILSTAIPAQPYLNFAEWMGLFHPPVLEPRPMPTPAVPEQAPEFEAESESEPESPPKLTGIAQQLAERSVAENQDVISETLAKLYAKQGYRDKSAQMYARLALLFPEKSAYFAAEIDKLKK